MRSHFTNTASKTLQRVFYVLLLTLLFGSLATFIAYAAGFASGLWDVYNRVYLFALLAYTWFIFILLFLGDLRPRTFTAYAGEKISVLIPCYNEPPELLVRSVESVIAAKGNKEIIVVDDGSTNAVHDPLRRLARDHGIKVHFFEANKGKRHALHHAVKHLISESDFIVTIDSDTVLDEHALIRVVEPLKDTLIGAATGDVQLLNEDENLLTKMIGSYYWVGLNVYKKAQSAAGIVVCCSGCLAAYKRSIIDEIIDDFVDQEFFGERCTHSEDRHLTNLVLQRGHQVVFVPEAISYTLTPSTLLGFLKQQQRWKRGYIRESLYTLSYAWRNRPLLFLQILLWDLTIPFFAFGLMLAMFITVIANPGMFLFVILPSWVTFMFVRYMPIVFYGRNKIRGLFAYMLFYEVFLYWQHLYALFTFKKKSWITR